MRDLVGGVSRARVLRLIEAVAILWTCVAGAAFLARVLLHPQGFGIDGRIYAAASRAWLDGADPWSIAIDGVRFAGPPPTLLMAAPLAALPTEVVPFASVVVAAVAAFVALRLAGARWWWLASVPFIEGVWVGSLDLLALALVLIAARLEGSRGALTAAFGGLAKIYALVPVFVLRPRAALGAALIVGVGTAALLPWSEWLGRSKELVGVLLEQSDGGKGAWAAPLVLVPLVAIALFGLGRQAGAWLIIPALWPASQVHYLVFLMPVAGATAAAMASSSLPAVGALAVIAEAVQRLLDGRLDHRTWLEPLTRRRSGQR